MYVYVCMCVYVCMYVSLRKCKYYRVQEPVKVNEKPNTSKNLTTGNKTCLDELNSKVPAAYLIMLIIPAILYQILQQVSQT